MRHLLLTSALFLISSPSFADCGRGSPDILTLTDWTVEEDTSRTIPGSKVEFTVRNNGAKAVRLVDAGVYFRDILGEQIASIAISRDIQIAPGEAAVDGGSYLGTRLDRIPKMNPADVVAFACTEAVVYEDGSIDEF